MKLGKSVQIAVCTSNLDDSIPFYAILGFKKIDEDVRPNRWMLITDGVVQILLNESSQRYTALYYSSEDAEVRCVALENEGVRPYARINAPGEPFQALYFDPSRFGIMLLKHDTYFLPDGVSFAKCGRFGELSIQVSDLPFSANYWLHLGFSVAYHTAEPYPFAVLTDGLMNIGLHQTKNFTQPTLTYFSPESAAIIAALKAEGLRFEQEIPDAHGVITHAVLYSPEGQAFFIFEGEPPMAS